MFIAFNPVDEEIRRRRLQAERDLYQSRIQNENITNLSLQNEALRTSIQAMRDTASRQSTIATVTPTLFAPPPSSAPTPSAPAANFPSLAEIRSMIESSQKKAQEDFTSKIDLFKTQEQQKQEEEQLSARNAATRMQNYQRQSAIGAWESALRGR